MSEPSVTIAICARNEERTLARVLESVLPLKSSKEIIVVDDGSMDRTCEIASSFVKDSLPIKILRHDVSCGKGAALQTAIKAAEGKYFAVQDADLEYEPSFIENAVEHMQKNSLDVVFGSRFLRENPTQYPMFLLGNKVVSWWVSLLTGIKITDAYTGTKVFKTAFLKQLNLSAQGFEIEAEMAVKVGILAKQEKLRYSEIPIAYHPRTKEEGKKIRVIDGFKACYYALSYRLSKI